MVFAFLVMAISTALSKSPRVSAESVAQAVIQGCGYLLLVEVVRREQLRSRVLFVACVVGLLVSVGYIGEVIYAWTVYWTLIGHLDTPPLRPEYASLVYGNPSPMLAMSALLTATLLAAVPRSRRGYLFAAFIVSVAATTVLLTGTRAGWAGIAIAVAVTSWLAMKRYSWGHILKVTAGRVTRSPLGMVRGALALGAALALAVVLAPGLMQRMGVGGEDVRASFYVASVRMAEVSPLTGVGPGMWPLERARNTMVGEADFAVAAAHNLYLHTVAEMGFLGSLAGVAGIAAIVWLVRDGCRDGRAFRRRWAFAAAFSVTYFAVHSLLDFLVNTPSTLLALAIPIAIVDATAERAPRKWPSARALEGRIGLGMSTLAVALTLGFSWWTTPATTVAGNAARSGNEGDWGTADMLARQARTMDPLRPAYLYLEGLTAAHVGDVTRSLNNLTQFADATDTPEAWIDVAALRLASSDRQGAREALGRGARLGVQHAALAVAITDLALRLDDTEMAIASGSAAIALSPTLIADPWWRSTASHSSIVDRVVDRSLTEALPEARWEIKLMAGDIDGAKAEAASTSNDYALSREVIAAWGGDVVAAHAVFARCDNQPLDGPIAWCARVALRSGYNELSARYAHVGALLHIDPDTLGELRIYPSLSSRSTAGGVSSKAGASWRQPVLWDVIVPGVARVANPLTQVASRSSGE
jgi:O-antigen ligase